MATSIAVRSRSTTWVYNGTSIFFLECYVFHFEKAYWSYSFFESSAWVDLRKGGNVNLHQGRKFSMETVIALVIQMSNRTKGTSWPRLHTTLHNPFSNPLQKFLCYCGTKRCLQSWRKTFYFDRIGYSRSWYRLVDGGLKRVHLTEVRQFWKKNTKKPVVY